jgi:hypothetical protein
LVVVSAWDCGVDEDRLKQHDLTDVEWARLGPLLSGHPRQGHLVTGTVLHAQGAQLLI